jgi:hypothetical protein
MRCLLRWGAQTGTALKPRRDIAAAWLSAALTFPATALACPDCSIGRVAREQLWSDNFATNLATALAPFLVIVVASLWAERIGRTT